MTGGSILPPIDVDALLETQEFMVSPIRPESESPSGSDAAAPAHTCVVATACFFPVMTHADTLEIVTTLQPSAPKQQPEPARCRNDQLQSRQSSRSSPT